MDLTNDKMCIGFSLAEEETQSAAKNYKNIYFGLTVLLIISLVLINIFSTAYDAKLKALQLKPGVKDNYYTVKHKSKADRYLTAFSLYRNYKRLVVPIKSDIGSDLAFLDGFRAILCCIIVQEHVYLLQFFHIVNPEFIENFWLRAGSRLVFPALVWLELFFVLSGLLLYVKFEKSQHITTKSSFLNCLDVFVRLLFSRYLRYLPSLIFVMIFTANITYYQFNNLGRSIIDPNCLACRDSWWLNILMINNYYIKYSCLVHTWYIAADFQLYSLFLIILIVMAKYPKTKFFVMVTVAVLAVFINFGLNYILKLESIFMLIPESYRYFYFKNITTAEHLYFSFYTNINSFLLGTICGYIYMKYLKKSLKNKKLLGKILRKSPPIGWSAIAGILYLGTRIMDHKETTIWTAAYGLLLRHVGLAIVAVIVVLRSMCNGGGVLNYAGFRFLSRISFQVYLWQIVVLLNISGHINSPIYLNYTTMIIFGVCLYIVTNVIAFVVALFMEYPLTEIISIINIERH